MHGRPCLQECACRHACSRAVQAISRLTVAIRRYAAAPQLPPAGPHLRIRCRVFADAEALACHAIVHLFAGIMQR